MSCFVVVFVCFHYDVSCVVICLSRLFCVFVKVLSFFCQGCVCCCFVVFLSRLFLLLFCCLMSCWWFCCLSSFVCLLNLNQSVCCVVDFCVAVLCLCSVSRCCVGFLLCCLLDVACC